MTKDDVGPTDKAAIFGLIYSLNLAIASHHFLYHDALTHLWSLGEEEQFYLVWPPLLLLLLPFASQRIIVCSLVGLIAAAQLHLQSVSSHANNWRVYDGPDTHCLPLIAGCLLAFVAPRLHIGSAVAIAAFVLFVWIVGHATIGQWAAIHYGPIVSFVSCLMILGALQPSPFSRVLGWRPFAQVGRVSYSVYLWHVPVLAFVPDARLAAVPISLVIACVSCRYVERPFRGKRKAASLAEASHRAVLPATT